MHTCLHIHERVRSCKRTLRHICPHRCTLTANDDDDGNTGGDDDADSDDDDDDDDDDDSGAGSHPKGGARA